MEGRKVIDTESDVLKDLEEKSVDNPTLSSIVSNLYEAIDILNRLESGGQEYDGENLKGVLSDLQNYTSILHRDIRELQMHRRYPVFENLLNFLVILFLLIGANLQTTTVVSKEHHQQLIQTTTHLKEQLRCMLHNPNFHPFFSVYVRDLSLTEHIEEAKSHLYQGDYKLAAHSLDTALRNIRGAVREI